MSEDLDKPETLYRFARLAVVVFSLLMALRLLILASFDLFVAEIESSGVRRCAIAVLFAICAIAAWGNGNDPIQPKLRRLRFLPFVLVGALWGTFWAFQYIYYIPTQWDEADHVLSGMAIQGYPTGYSTYRSPITIILCGIFYPQINLLNPILGIAIFVIVAIWLKQMKLALAIPGIGLLLLGSDEFLLSNILIMGELPAALFLLAAFFCLYREYILPTALFLALAVLSRWNLAPIALVTTLLVGRHFDWKKSALMVFSGVLAIVAWYAWTKRFHPNPIQAIFEYASSAHQWTDAGSDLEPTLFSRSYYYVQNWFFITPLGLLTVLLSPFLGQEGKDGNDRWVFRVVIPISLVIYFGTMISTGSFVSRFMTPIIPLVWILFFENLKEVLQKCRLAEGYAILLLLTIVPTALSLYNTDSRALIYINKKIRYHSPINITDAHGIQLALTMEKGSLKAPSIDPIHQQNGFLAMLPLKRSIEFPAARRTTIDAIEPDPQEEAISKLVKTIKPGDLLLLPSAINFQPDEKWERVYQGEYWQIVRILED